MSVCKIVQLFIVDLRYCRGVHIPNMLIVVDVAMQNGCTNDFYIISITFFMHLYVLVCISDFIFNSLVNTIFGG